METQKKYYLGLDMGTTSVGWAVTDENYHLMRAKGKDMWGVRLFAEANTAAERRVNRTNRRRRQREVARLGLLREYFADEISKVDPGFYVRLDESKFHKEERTEGNQQKYALFADHAFTDKEYYDKYPTIFHLRNELIHSPEPHDVRLVYLAIANMFHHRGNFLNTTMDAEDAEGSFAELYETMMTEAASISIALPCWDDIDGNMLEDKLGERGVSRSRIVENVAVVLGITKKQKKQWQLVQLICGLSVKLKDLFGEESLEEENKKLAICFRASNYEELLADVQEAISEEGFDLLMAAKAIHDKGLLSSIIKGHEYLSEARIASYETHKKDLAQLKQVLKRYDMAAYNKMFRTMEDGNYSAYIGSVNSVGCMEKKERRTGKRRSVEDLYKTIRTTFKNMSEEAQSDPDVLDILRKIDAEIFLPKQLTGTNGVIPNQLHTKELKAILRQAEGYLPFLKQVDQSGLTVSQQIISIFTFQIPYYVGPLGRDGRGAQGKNAWAQRLEQGRIYPWNLEQKIDVEQASQDFIERMVRHCTYLSGARTLPKQSLLYQRFEVLNELNKLKIRGDAISVELKQDIYQDLFLTGKKVSLKVLKDYLQKRGHGKIADDEITGIDGGFKSTLSSLGKFYGALGDRALWDENKEMIENIIFWGTIYGNDKKFIRAKIKKEYKDALSVAEIKRILGFKFEGWGNLSKEFLQLEGASKEDGEIRSLIGALWNTNDNLMELLSSRYTFKENVNEMTKIAEKPLTEWSFDDLEETYLSAPVKRMVWQTLQILREIETVMGCAPERIFVEMTRSEEEKGVRKDSRKKKLQDLYKGIGKEAAQWKKELENRPESDFRIKKLYLYYLQMGKCMYTGEEIDLDELMQSNSKYDIDHIYPRHFVKDDSLENNLVLVNKQKNAGKLDKYPVDPETQAKMRVFWKLLYDKQFISKTKYERLTCKEEFSAERKAGFIARQLVETGQGTKAISRILKQAFPKEDLVYAKAGNVSSFRNEFDLPKVRCINDLHHAQDAYLNIVVGNTYFVKFTNNPLWFIKQAEKDPENIRYKYNMDKVFAWNVKDGEQIAWVAPKKGETMENQTGTIATVRKVMSKNTPLVTKQTREIHGGITRKVTVWNAETAGSGEGYIPVKMNDPRLQNVARYGGLRDVQTAGYTLVEYTVKDKTIRSLEALPIYLGKVEILSEEVMLEYFTRQLKAEHKGKEVAKVRICRKFIPLNSLLKYNGFYYYLGGKTGGYIYFRSAVQACFGVEELKYIKKVEKAVSTGYYLEKGEDKIPVLTREKNIELYGQFKEKYKKNIFGKKMGSIGSTIEKCEMNFRGLALEEQCKMLKALIDNFNQVGNSVDLSLMGGKSNTGTMLSNKKISDAKECILISQSPTGLFQSEIDLLHV